MEQMLPTVLGFSNREKMLIRHVISLVTQKNSASAMSSLPFSLPMESGGNPAFLSILVG